MSSNFWCLPLSKLTHYHHPPAQRLWNLNMDQNPGGVWMQVWSPSPDLASECQEQDEEITHQPAPGTAHAAGLGDTLWDLSKSQKMTALKCLLLLMVFKDPSGHLSGKTLLFQLCDHGQYTFLLGTCFATENNDPCLTSLKSDHGLDVKIFPTAHIFGYLILIYLVAYSGCVCVCVCVSWGNVS